MGAVTSALALCGLAGVDAGLGATAASATPAASHHCPSSKGKYPPGKCRLFLSRHTAHHGQHVGSVSGAVFKPGETVTGTLSCGSHFTKALVTKTAPKSGVIRHNTHIGRHVPAPSTCTLTLHGHHSGIRLSASFKVKK